MSTPQSLWDGITAAFYGVILSILMLFVFGISAENIMTQFELISLFDIAAPWNTGYEDASWGVTALYMICIAPAVIGIIVLFMSAIKTQEYDVFADAAPEQSVYGNQSMPQNITSDEIAWQQQFGGR